MLRNGPGIAVGVMAIALALAPASARGDDKTDAKVKQLQAELDKAKKEGDGLRQRNVQLELELRLLKSDLELHKRIWELEQLLNKQTELEQSRLEQFQKKIAEEKLKIDQMRAERAGMTLEEWREASPDRKNTIPLPLAPLPREPDKVPANLRGEVTAAAGDQVMLSIGIDAGLVTGTTLDIYRLDEKTPRYLGTVKVTSALHLFPKQAIVTFTPARKVALDKLRPEELPKKGDEVRPLNALTGDR